MCFAFFLACGLLPSGWGCMCDRQPVWWSSHIIYPLCVVALCMLVMKLHAHVSAGLGLQRLLQETIVAFGMAFGQSISTALACFLLPCLAADDGVVVGRSSLSMCAFTCDHTRQPSLNEKQPYTSVRSNRLCTVGFHILASGVRSLEGRTATSCDKPCCGRSRVLQCKLVRLKQCRQQAL